MNINLLISLIGAISIFSLILFVYFKGGKNKLNILFIRLNLCFVFWNIMLFCSCIIKEKEIYALVHKFFSISIYFISACFFHFIIYFCQVQNKKINRFLLSISYFLAILIYSISWLISYDFVYCLRWMPISTITNKLFFITLIFYALYSIYLLWIRYRISVFFLEKSQIKYFFIAIFFFFLTGLTNFPHIFWIKKIMPLGKLGCIFYILCIIYSILKFHFLNIKIRLNRRILLIIVIGFIVLFSALFIKFIFAMGNVLTTICSCVLIITTICIIFFTPFKKFIIYRNKYYDYQDIIYNISKKIDVCEFDQFLNYVIFTVTKTLKVKNTYILLKKKSNFYIHSYFGINKKIIDNYLLEENSIIIKWIKQNGMFVKQEQEKILSENEFNEIYQDLKQMDASIIIPLFYRNILEGILIIGSKKNNFIYDEMDFEILETLASQLTIVIKNAKLYTQSITDGLTKLYTHQYFIYCLKNEIDYTIKYKFPISLIMMDIDDFKKINDQYGHIVGDIVLKRIGEIIKQLTRSTDIQARYGGDEFSMIFPQTSSTEARVIMRTLQDKIKNEKILKNIVAEYELPQELDNLEITMSIGISGIILGKKWEDKDLELVKNLLKIADSALYQAKEKGKNQIEIIEI